MARPKPIIHIEVVENDAEPTEADMRRWVRATEILLQIKARRDARTVSESGGGQAVEQEQGVELNRGDQKDIL